MLFLAIARLASLFVLLGQHLVQCGHVQRAWADGPPAFAEVDNVILYWTDTHDYVQIDLKYGAQRSTGVFRYRERPFAGQEVSFAPQIFFNSKKYIVESIMKNITK